MGVQNKIITQIELFNVENTDLLKVCPLGKLLWFELVSIPITESAKSAEMFLFGGQLQSKKQEVGSDTGTIFQMTFSSKLSFTLSWSLIY